MPATAAQAAEGRIRAMKSRHYGENPGAGIVAAQTEIQTTLTTVDWQLLWECLPRFVEAHSIVAHMRDVAPAAHDLHAKLSQMSNAGLVEIALWRGDPIED
jgi:hypothetical protein